MKEMGERKTVLSFAQSTYCCCPKCCWWWNRNCFCFFIASLLNSKSKSLSLALGVCVFIFHFPQSNANFLDTASNILLIVVIIFRFLLFPSLTSHLDHAPSHELFLRLSYQKVFFRERKLGLDLFSSFCYTRQTYEAEIFYPKWGKLYPNFVLREQERVDV